MAVTIFIKNLTGKIYEITFSDDENPFETATVADLKDGLYRISGIPVEEMRIIYGGTQLEDDRLLSEYRIQHESTVHLRLRLRGGERVPHGMGEREGRNASKEQLSDFFTDTDTDPEEVQSEPDN